MPAMAVSRVGARVVESGPGGEDLPVGTWQRLDALPDPRSPQGRIYPLACLIAIAVCAFTAAGNDRFTAVGQWIRRASQQDLARLRAHHVRDVTFGEDTSASRTGSGPVNLATIRAAVITALKDAGYLHIPEGRRDHTTPAETLRLHGLD